MSRLLGLGAPFPEFSLQACVSAEPGSEFRIVDSREEIQRFFDYGVKIGHDSLHVQHRGKEVARETWVSSVSFIGVKKEAQSLLFHGRQCF